MDAASSSECRTCINENQPHSTVSCEDAGTQLCPALLLSCNCGPCRDNLVEYYECTYRTAQGCASFDCSTLSTDATPPTIPPEPVAPAPTPPAEDPASEGACAEELETARSCLDTTLDFETNSQCKNCVNKNIPPHSLPCEAIQEICPFLQQCDCDLCQEKVLAYFNCAFQKEYECPLFECGSAPNRVCVSELDNARTCLDNDLDISSATECKNCVNVNIRPASESCDAAKQLMCPALKECDCSVCREKVTDYFTCSYQKDSGCRFDCDAVEGATDQPRDICADEREAFESCLVELAPLQSMTCKVCENEALPMEAVTSPASLFSVPEDDCSSVNTTALCSTFSACDCGSCINAAARYKACEQHAISPANQCTIDCDESSSHAGPPVSLFLWHAIAAAIASALGLLFEIL